jgi:hypothetical protein
MTSPEQPLKQPQSRPQSLRKSTRQINALLKKMVQLKIVQPGQNKEDNNSAEFMPTTTPTPEFAAFMAEAKKRYLSRTDKIQQLVMSNVNPTEEGSLTRAQTILTGLMIAEYIGGNTEIEVFGLTFKQREQMADAVVKIGEHMNFVKYWELEGKQPTN